MKSMKVEEIMSEDLITVESSESLLTAFNLMLEHDIRHLPVVDADGNIEGVLSDRDLIRKTMFTEADILNRDFRQALESGRVQDVMTRKAETVAPEDDVREAGTLLLENKFSCLPVVNGVQLVGILTESDFVRAIVQS